MRGVPGLRRLVVTQALAVDVAEHRGALRALGPVAAGAVLARREGAAVWLRAGERIVVVGRVADARLHGAALGQRGLRAELVVGPVQVIDILGDDLFLEVLPRPAPDAIARVDGLATTRRLRAEIRMPGLGAGAGALGQLLADAVGAFEPTEIGALAGAGAGDE